MAGIKGPAVVRKVTAPAAVVSKANDDTTTPDAKKASAATYAPPAVASSVPLIAGAHQDNNRPPVAAIGVVGQAIYEDGASTESLRQHLAAMERRVAELEAAARRDAGLRKIVMEQARVIEKQGKDIAQLKSLVSQKPSTL